MRDHSVFVFSRYHFLPPAVMIALVEPFQQLQRQETILSSSRRLSTVYIYIYIWKYIYILLPTPELMNIPWKKTATGAWATHRSWNLPLSVRQKLTKQKVKASMTWIDLGLFICITKTIKSMSKTKIQEKMKKCQTSGRAWLKMDSIGSCESICLWFLGCNRARLSSHYMFKHKLTK